MSLKYKPFTPLRLEEERAKDKHKVLTVRLNQKEQEILKEIMTLLDIKSEGTAMKIATAGYLQCITTSFSREHLSWLFKKERSRLSDYENIE